MQRNVIFFVTSLLSVGFISRQVVLAEVTVNQELDAGFQQEHVNSPESKYEEYGEVPDGVVIRRYELNAEGEKIDFEFDVNNLRLDNQSAGFEFDTPKYGVSGSWDQVPHLYSKEARTLYSDQGNGDLTLPDPIQQAMQAGGNSNFVVNYTSFAAGAHVQELKTQSNTGKLGFDFNLTDTLKLNVAASETMKKGYKAEGIRIDGDFTEIARPVDFKTYNANAGLGYAGKNLQWGLNYDYSSFKNDIESLTVDNIFQYTNTATKSRTGANSLEPDNDAHSVNLRGGVDLPVHSRLTANISYIYMRQNQTLMPYTSNPFYAESDPSTLPTDKVDAKTINLIQDYDLKIQPVKPIDLGIRFHSDQLHNETTEIVFPIVFETESSSSTDPISNEPFNYRKNALTGSFGWKISAPLHIELGGGREWVSRDDREVEETHENSLNFSADYKMAKSTLIRASYLTSKRRMEDFSEDHNQNPNIRLFDVSDRDRDQGDLMIQINSGRMSTSLNGGLGHDQYFPGEGDLTEGNTNYSNHLMGLVETRMARAGIDFNFDVSERVGLYTYYEYQQDKTIQRADTRSSNQSSSNNGEYSQRQDTRYNMGGIGINISAVKEFLDIYFKYAITDSRANYDFLYLDSFNATSALGGGPKIAPAETKTTKQNFSLKGKARATANLDVTLGYLFEKYDVFDWATDNLGLVAPASSNQRNIFLGDASHDYKAHIVSIMADYRF